MCGGEGIEKREELRFSCSKQFFFISQWLLIRQPDDLFQRYIDPTEILRKFPKKKRSEKKVQSKV